MPKDIKTQERILTVSKQLFAQYGMKQTSIQMIADGVGIKNPSLYYFFKNKEEIYVTLLEDILTTLGGIFDSTENIEMVLTQLFKTVKNQGSFMFAVNTLSVDSMSKINPLIVTLKKQITNYLSQQKLHCSTQEATMLIMDASESYGRKYSAGEKVVSPQKYAALLSKLLEK